MSAYALYVMLVYGIGALIALMTGISLIVHSITDNISLKTKFILFLLGVFSLIGSLLIVSMIA